DCSIRERADPSPGRKSARCAPAGCSMPGASESGSDLPCRNRSCRTGARGAASRSRRSRSLQNARRFEKLLEARAGFRRSVERGDKGVILLGAQREFAAVRERLGRCRKPLVKNEGADGLALDRCGAPQHRLRLGSQTYLKAVLASFRGATPHEYRLSANWLTIVPVQCTDNTVMRRSNEGFVPGMGPTQIGGVMEIRVSVVRFPLGHHQ